MSLDNNSKVFFDLLRAGLWGKEARLSQYKDIDYSAIFKLAGEQSVVGLITAGLERVCDVKIPKDVILQFVGSTLQIEQQNRSMNEFIERLIARLRKEKVNAVLVKGQGIAQCYEKPLWRSSGDIDLLLSDSNYDKAKEVLMPLATEVETEYTSFKHVGMTINGWVVELHGTLHSRLSGRVDSLIDELQKDVLCGGNVRSWDNGGTQVFLPSPDNDVIFVFTHFLQHFFFEGIGLRQICDWCRLLWTYRDSLEHGLLESRIRKMGLMTEWKAFAAFVVKWLGMQAEAMPLYSYSASADIRWERKAERICSFVLEVGNFGHNQRRDYRGMSYLRRKFVSVCGRFSDMLRHFRVFPRDSIVFFGGVLRSGLHAAVRGE